MFRLPQTILQTPLLCSHDKILFSTCERITIALFLLQAFTWRAVAEIVSKFKLPVRLVDKHVPTGQKLTVTNNREKKVMGTNLSKRHLLYLPHSVSLNKYLPHSPVNQPVHDLLRLTSSADSEVLHSSYYGLSVALLKAFKTKFFKLLRMIA